METSEASVGPLRAIAHDNIAILVEFVSISGERGTHTERVVLAKLQTEGDGKVAPLVRLRRHVIGDAGSEFVDEADFAYGVVLVVILHLEVV